MRKLPFELTDHIASIGRHNSDRKEQYSARDEAKNRESIGQGEDP